MIENESSPLSFKSPHNHHPSKIGKRKQKTKNDRKMAQQINGKDRRWRNQTQNQACLRFQQYKALLTSQPSVPHHSCCHQYGTALPRAWVGAKNFGFTEEQKNIEQGSIKLKELHVCIMRVQKQMAAWRSEVP